MDQDSLIRSLKLQLLIERIVILAIVLIFIGRWSWGVLESRPYAIYVDNKPVALVASEDAGNRVLDKVKSSVDGVDASDVSFDEDVRIGRGPSRGKALSVDQAARVVAKKLSPMVMKYAILVDRSPAVAVDSEEMAGTVLEAAKQKFGSMVKNLMEEPQFKQQITIEEMLVDPSMYYSDVEGAVIALTTKSGGSGLYTVADGDVASKIARRFNMSLDQLQVLNGGKDLDRLQIGEQIRVSMRGEKEKPTLTVIVRDRETATEVIPYNTESVSNMQLFAGKQTELNPGRNGLRQVVRAVTYENGVRTGMEVIEETRLRNPVPRRIAVGIRPR